MERNWIKFRAEIDIIAWKEDVLVFVEVKTRKNLWFGTPEDAVDVRKMQQLEKGSLAYIEEKKHYGDIRFDIVSLIIADNVVKEIVHFEDVFFPMN